MTMTLDRVWVCPECDNLIRNTLEDCPRCGYIKDIDTEAETKIVPPVEVKEEKDQ